MRLWARLPEAPDMIGTGLFLLISRDFAPLEQRLEAIAGRLEAVPAYLVASQERLTEPAELWTRLAIDKSQALPALYQSLVAAATGPGIRRRLEQAATAAAEATAGYARWLEQEALPRSSSGWALGEERFERLIALRRLPDTATEIRALGARYLVEFKEERAALLAEHWPGRPLEEVKALVRSDHAGGFEAALTEYREVIGRARAFVETEGLASLPGNEELRVQTTPAFLRPVIPFAAYEPPAHFDPRQLGIYIVTPHGPELGEHNRPAVVNTSVHEGYPGHHLQFSCASHNPSIARLLAAEFAAELVEGWAHYCEQLMHDSGFATGPEVRFVQLNDLIWRACRILIDVDLSSGRMQLRKAISMLVEEAAMEQAAAVAEVRRYSYTPGYQLSYLYGRHLLMQLREQRRRAEGPAFDLRAFHDRLLYGGGLPAIFWPSQTHSALGSGTSGRSDPATGLTS
jgi:uncharacterized protein (DUF885 family)